MALTVRYTTTSGPGDSTDQSLPGSSLGGYAATNTYGGSVLGDLFSRASTLDVADARADYRALFVYNTDTTDTFADVRVHVAAVTAGGAGIAVGVDPRPATYVDSLSPNMVEVTSAYSAPAGVTFSAPANYTAGVQLGDLLPETGRGFWVKRIPSATAAGLVTDACDVTIESPDGTIVRRVYWDTEAVSLPTRPPILPRPYTPTPSPFRRLAVDFLAAGGSRVTWEMDATVRDDGPYVYQLQGSRYGTPDATDWADIGPPAQDAVYLLDPTARLWGANKEFFYRVVLSTASTSYTSKSVGSFGRLDIAGWLIAREILRKEELVMKQLVRMDGFLLKARRFGTRCSCIDQYTGEVGNSSDPVCYGTGFSGGYMPPVALSFCVPTVRQKKERVAYNEGAGIVLPDTTKVRMAATTPVTSRDVWVSRGGDERFYVHEIAEIASWQGVPLVYEVTLKLAPRGDVIYTFAVTRPAESVPEWKQATTLEI